MAKRPSVTSIRSKQNQVLRYVVSTNVDKAAKDLGVSTKSLRKFVSASPETVKKNPINFGLLKSTPATVAKEKDVKLVQRLSGKRLRDAYPYFGKRERTTQAIRFAQVTRTRRRIIEDDVVKYVPVAETKGRIARKQILSNMGATSAKSVMWQYNEGTITETEARDLLIKLWKNSGVSASKAHEYFDNNS